MVAAELAAGIGALKASFDLAKAVKDLTDESKRAAVSIELQQQLLAAQQVQSELIRKISSLETEIARHETWETDKQAYELHELEPGFFAYVIKEKEHPFIPLHAICQKCYQNRKTSILQSNGEMQIYKHAWECPECKSTFRCQSRRIGEMLASAIARQNTGA